MDSAMLGSTRCQLPAGPSHRCAPMLHSGRQRPQCRIRSAAALSSSALQHQRRTVVANVSRKTVTSAPSLYIVDEEDEYRITRKTDVEPDYDDDKWVEKVEDWNDFWTYQKWNDEVETLANFETEEHYMSESGMQRAQKLIAALDDMDFRQGFISWLPDIEDVHEEEDNWENSPVPVEGPDPNPDLSAFDLRAMTEKKRYKDILDAEWRRRQALIGKLDYPHKRDYIAQDVRLEQYLWQYRKWGDEEIYNWIINNGLNCRPEDHKGIVENPFLKADYHGVHNVNAIEDTEDFLERIGHWASPEVHARFNETIIMDEDDFDPIVVDAVFDSDGVHFDDSTEYVLTIRGGDGDGYDEAQEAEEEEEEEEEQA